MSRGKIKEIEGLSIRLRLPVHFSAYTSIERGPDNPIISVRLQCDHEILIRGAHIDHIALKVVEELAAMNKWVWSHLLCNVKFKRGASGSYSNPGSDNEIVVSIIHCKNPKTILTLERHRSFTPLPGIRKRGTR